MRKRKEVVNGSAPEVQRFWVGHIDRWRSSGISIREYCQSNGISLSSFYYRKYRQEAAERDNIVRGVSADNIARSNLAQRSRQLNVAVNTSRATQLPSEFPFVPVKLLEASLGNSNSEQPVRSNDPADRLEVTTPRGYRIRICPDTNMGFLSVLLFTLEHQQC